MTTEPVISEPPVLAGAVQTTFAAVLPHWSAYGHRGAPGAVAAAAARAVTVVSKPATVP